jgi:hypothetical protein
MVNDRLETALIIALISDAGHDIRLWNNIAPSMQERVLLAGMSRSLHYLRSIFRRQLGGWPAVPEDGNWEDHAREFASLLNRAAAVRGVTVGEHLDKLAAGLTEMLAASGARPADGTSKDQSQSPVVQNEFRQEGETWVIVFDGERCRLKDMVGLGYIAALLRRPGSPIRAIELQSLVPTKKAAIQPSAKSARDSREYTARKWDEGGEEQNLGFDTPGLDQDEILDDKGVARLEARRNQLEAQVALGVELNEADQGEYACIDEELTKARTSRRRRRAFSNENEKARISITLAIARGIDRIRKAGSERTASYLEDQVTTGSEFLYRDSSLRWLL